MGMNDVILDFGKPRVAALMNANKKEQKRCLCVKEGVLVYHNQLAAIQEVHPDGLLRRMLAKRLTAMTSMSGWPSFSKGWARRVATLLEM